MTSKLCALCLGNLEYQITVWRGDHRIKLYRCQVCGEEFEEKSYRYMPHTCPKHIWAFSHRIFEDSKHDHKIEMVFMCDRCGAEFKKRQDTKEAGLSGRVEIDHPLVLPTLIYNEAAEKLMEGKDAVDIWKERTKHKKEAIRTCQLGNMPGLQKRN